MNEFDVIHADFDKLLEAGGICGGHSMAIKIGNCIYCGCIIGRSVRFDVSHELAEKMTAGLREHKVGFTHAH